MPNTDSNAKLAIRDLDANEWVVPYVIEPSAGVDRGVLAVLNEAYRVEDLGDGKERTGRCIHQMLADWDYSQHQRSGLLMQPAQ